MMLNLYTSLAYLPKEDHITVLSSKTAVVNEQVYNEIILLNIKDKEQIYIKAAKDYMEPIRNDFHQSI